MTPSKIGKLSSPSGLVPIGRAAARFIRNMEARNLLLPICTGSGFHSLDEFTGGFQPGDFILVGGRPGMGVTSFLVDVAWHNVQTARRGVLYFNLEDPGDRLLQRTLSIIGGFDPLRFRGGIFDAGEKARLVEAIATLSKSPLLINEQPHLLYPALRQTAIQAVKQHHNFKIGLCIIDSLPLLRLSKTSCQKVTAEEELAILGPRLKQLAHDLGIPIIAGVGLPDSVESRGNKVPRLTDLRRQGALVDSADQVILLYRERYYRPRPETLDSALFVVAKNRHGGEGFVGANFSGFPGRFSDLVK